ncbi:ComEC/Rec2 family competence protein [Pseudochelatococcus sp. B33]
MPLAAPAWLRFAAAEAGDLGSRWRVRLTGWLALEAERRRLFLWLPVAYGTGVAFYFAADREPAPWSGPVAAAVMIAVAVMLRGHWRARTAAMAAGVLFLGFSMAAMRTQWVAQPVLNRTVIAPVTGFVRSVEERPQGPRAIIDVEDIGGLAAGERPARVRIGLRRGTAIAPGTRIVATARLVPPPQPARPGGYDFARDAFFGGIGAVGSVNGRVEAIAGRHPPTPPGARLAAWIDNHRNALTRRIIEAGGGPLQGSGHGKDGEERARGQEAAFVAALVTGKRGMLTDETNESLRAAGIYHVVSIGGFHMTLVAGTIFFLARALLALSPGMALRRPVRKAAAVAGIAGAGVYCVFSGAGIDTLRALVVTLIVMGAILADRPALSMRNLALAAFVCLTFQPETLLGPSFQMSFAGVAALIALFERWSDGARAHGMMPLREGGGLHLPDAGLRGGRLYRLVVVSTATTVVAMLATGPFSTYHFQTFNPWGLVGNAFGLPLVELLVMPLAFMGVMAYPLGLDGPFWHLAGLAAAPVLAGSTIIEGFAGAVVVVPSFGPGVLVLLVAALLWTCLWTTPLRWFAILPAGLGVALAAMPDRPDMLIDREGRGAMVRAADGRYLVLGRPSAFTVEQWLRSDGDPRRAGDPSLRAGVACDRIGCVTVLPEGRSVAFALDERAAYEDCTRAAVVVTRWRAPENCAARHVIDRTDLDRHGALALIFEGDDLVIRGRPDGENGNVRAGDAGSSDNRPWRRPAHR